MKFAHIVAVAVALPLLAACTGPYILNQGGAFVTATNEFTAAMKEQRFAAIRLRRAENAMLSAAAFGRVSATPGERELISAFVDASCNHQLYVIGAGLGTLGQHSAALAQIAEAPADESIGALLGGIRASLKTIKQLRSSDEDKPKEKIDPAVKCKAAIRADLGEGATLQASLGRQNEFDFIFAVETLIKSVLKVAEGELRGKAASEYIKISRPSIEAAFYVVACPEGYNEKGQPAEGVAITPEKRGPTGCGPVGMPSRLNNMLKEARVLTLHRALQDFRAVVQTPVGVATDLLKRRKVADSMAEALQVYDGYRRLATVDEDDDLLQSLHQALWKAMDAMEKGPRKGSDVLDAVFLAVHNIDQILKDHAAYREKREAK